MKKGVKSLNYFRVLFILALAVFIFQIVFALGGLFSESRGLVGNLLITSLSFLATIASFILYRRIPVNFPLERKGSFLLFISVFLFFLGDLIWFIEEVFAGNLVPIGGAADWMWNIGYVFLIISVLYFISIGFRPSPKVKVGIIILGLLIGGAILYFDVVEDLNENSFTVPHLFQEMYILYDLVLIFLIIYLIWPLMRLTSRYFVIWIILGFSVFTRLVHDRIFVEMTREGTYYTGHPVDLLYVLFYLLIFVYVYIKIKNLEVKQ